MSSFFLSLVPNAMAIIGLWSLIDWMWKRFTFFRTKGKVVDFEESTDTDSGWYYHAVVIFDYKGQQYRKVDAVGIGWKLARVGQLVSVRFPDGKPERASIEWLWIPTAYAIVALMGLSLTTYIFVR